MVSLSSMALEPEDTHRNVEVQICARSSAFSDDDPRWRRQVTDLLTQLSSGAVPVRMEEVGKEGEKGGAVEIILALDTSGVIAAAVPIFRAWLARSGDRSVKISGKVGDRDIDLEITAKNVSEQTLRQALNLAQGSK